MKPKTSPVYSIFFIVIISIMAVACNKLDITANEAEKIVISNDGDFSATSLMAPPSTGWLTNGGNLFNQRWSPLEQINKENVSQLKGVWRAHLDGSGMDTRHSGEAQPLVYDGVIYMITGEDDVFALSVASGEKIWSRKSELPKNLGKSICCGWISRGVGLGENKIFVGQLDGKLLALDKNNGEVVWEIQAARWQEGYSLTAAPLYFDGMVITGFAGAEYGVHGKVNAYDAEDGSLLWSFNTIPGPGELGHDTWPQDSDAWKHGGGSVWQTPAIDPEANLIYFSTGNPGPDFNGAVRPGDNLFTASIVALDVITGEYRWHFQEVHHDIWDYDGSNPVILFDYELNGQMRKGIAQAGKTGWVYILDRLTGEPLIGIEERAVPQMEAQFTSATQPYPKGESFVPQFIDMAPEGVTLINQGRIFTPYGPGQPVMVQPSPAGSANWAPSSYDPSRGKMYICAAESAMTLGGGDLDLEIPKGLDGELFTGGGFNGSSRTQGGVIVAMDLKTNTIDWQYRWDDTCYSGFVSTAGDLLFVGRNDGRLSALDIDTGHQLWEFQTGAGMNSTVSIFEEAGQQYVLAYSAGNLFAGTDRGDSMWLFSLTGSLAETTAGDMLIKQVNETAEETLSSLDDIQVIYASGDPDYSAGRKIYEQTCLPCHGVDGLSGHGGGAPLNTLTKIDEAISVITLGRKKMPMFARALKPEQIRDVAAYVMDGLFE